MSTKVTRKVEVSEDGPTLHVALELAEKSWKVAFTTGLGQKPRQKSVRPGIEALQREIAAAQRRFGLPETVRVVSCYEAGMEGFWLDRALASCGLENVVVDSSSIDVSRRRRRAKTDRLDAAALVMKLVRYHAGDRHVWSVVRVPPVSAEDLRHNDRELERLGGERTALRNAIRGLLKTQGVRLERVVDLPQQLESVRLWDGSAVGSELRFRLLRIWERFCLVEQQVAAVTERRRELLGGGCDVAEKARQLQTLKTLGETMSWRLSVEIFGWRTFSNRRQLGGLLGLGAVPYQSGDDHRDLGISKAGRRQLRASLIELSWLWLRFQPDSSLSHWYQERFAEGGKRLRRIGIVALARRLLIELWRFLETGALPEGATTKA